ncbi:unnamed protein product [Closterium sp. Yama58-4]|nr:unnamed protein product [Closterium sp. Yama58-4]
MDDLERAILFSFDQSGAVDVSLRARAHAFCAEARRSPQLWRVCIERLISSRYPEVQFWCLQALEELLLRQRLRADGHPQPAGGASSAPGDGGAGAGAEGEFLPPEALAELRETLMAVAFRCPVGSGLMPGAGDAQAGGAAGAGVPLCASWPAFIRNKVAQVIVLLIRLHYPTPWHTAFDPIVSALMAVGAAANPQTSAAASTTGAMAQAGGGDGAGAWSLVSLDMACRVLAALDQEVLSIEYARTAEESAAAMRVKDGMREGCIAPLVHAWYCAAVALLTALGAGGAAGAGAQQGGMPGSNGVGGEGGEVVLRDGRGSPVSRDDAAASVAALLETLQPYVAWIDIGLVADSRWLPLLFGLLAAHTSDVRLRSAACGCILAIVNKRMDAVSKVALLQRVQIAQVAGVRVVEEIARADEGLTLRLAELLTGAATEIMECIKKLEAGGGGGGAGGRAEAAAQGFGMEDGKGEGNGGGGEASESVAVAATAAAQGMLDAILPAIFFLAQRHPDEDVSANCFQFLLFFVADMRRVGGASSRGAAALAATAAAAGAADAAAVAVRERQEQQLRQVLLVVGERMRYPESSCEALDLPTKEGEEEEERVGEQRKDLFVLLRSAAKVNPSVVRAFVHETLAAALARGPHATFAETEAAVQLFYQLGEGVTEEALKPGSGALGEMTALLLSSPSSASSAASQQQGAGGAAGGAAGGGLRYRGHRLVAVAWLEVIVRYVRFVQQHPHYIPAALDAFLGPWGVGHKAITSAPPAAAGKAAGGQGRAGGPFGRGEGAFDDRIYAYEAVGLLLAQEEVPTQQQAACLSALLTPLIARADALAQEAQAAEAAGGGAEVAAGMVAALQQVIMAMSYLSKGFAAHMVTTTRPELAQLFKGAVECVLRVLLALPRSRPTRSKVTSFLHRMADCLGPHIIPFLPQALPLLLNHCEARDMVECLQLISLLTAKHRAHMAPIVDALLAPLFTRLSVLLPSSLPSLMGPPNTTSDASGTPEEVREQREVLRAVLMLLHGITMADLHATFLSPANASQVLPRIITLLLDTAALHADIALRKVAVACFIRFASDWCSCDPEKAPGFRAFLLEQFLPTACLLPCLQPSFSLQDANSALLVNDISLALLALHHTCGQLLSDRLLSSLLPSLNCPPTLAANFCTQLQRGDAKIARDAFREFLVQLRAQHAPSQGNIAMVPRGFGFLHRCTEMARLECNDQELAYLTYLLGNDLLDLDLPAAPVAQPRPQRSLRAPEVQHRALSVEPVLAPGAPTNGRLIESTIFTHVGVPQLRNFPQARNTLRGAGPFHGRSLSAPSNELAGSPSAAPMAFGSMVEPATLLSWRPPLEPGPLAGGAAAPAPDPAGCCPTANAAATALAACDLGAKQQGGKPSQVLRNPPEAPEMRRDRVSSRALSDAPGHSTLSPVKSQKQSHSFHSRAGGGGITKKSSTEKNRRARVSQGFSNLREVIPREFLSSHIQKTRGFTQRADLCTLLNAASDYIKYMKGYKADLEAQLLLSGPTC